VRFEAYSVESGLGPDDVCLLNRRRANVRSHVAAVAKAADDAGRSGCGARSSGARFSARVTSADVPGARSKHASFRAAAAVGDRIRLSACVQTILNLPAKSNVVDLAAHR
jgi:hypothetical protein